MRTVTLLALATLMVTMTGCTRNTVKKTYGASGFNLDEFRTAHSVLVVADSVEVLAFRKSRAALFPGDSLSDALTRGILDSLHRSPAVSIRPAPGDVRGMLHDGSIDSLSSETRAKLSGILESLGARHLVLVHHVTISSAMRKFPRTVLPGIGGMQPAGGTQAEKCVVFLTAEVRKVPGLELEYAFTVQSMADADPVLAPKSLVSALEGAARQTASHLRGY